MKIRKHRGTIAESMATVQEIEPTRQAVSDWFHEWWIGAPISLEQIQIRPVPPHVRVPGAAWRTHVVIVDGLGVLGFTDGPVEGE